MSDQNLSQGGLKASIKSGFAVSVWGALILVLGLSIAVPKAMVWYFEPPINPGCSCATSIEWALGLNLKLQWVGMVVGSVFGFYVGYRLKKRQLKS